MNGIVNFKDLSDCTLRRCCS